MTRLVCARLATFGTVSLFALIVMSLSANLIAIAAPFYFAFSGFALATSLLTLGSVIPIFVIDTVRQGTIFSYIIVEAGVLSLLWILWLSSGSYAAWTDSNLSSFSCNFEDFGDGFVDDIASQGCQEIKVIAAFSFLTWLTLTAYVGTLILLAIRAQQRGHNVWSMSVREEAVLYPEAKSGGISAQIPTTPASFPQKYPQAYPPAPGPAPVAVQV